MKYQRHQFTNHYYQLWQMGLLLPEQTNFSVYSVKFRKNNLDQYSRVTLKAASVSDALERACFAITYSSPWRPEDIDLHAVYDSEENLLWIDEEFYNIVQKKHEFRGMERREFLMRFGATTAVVLYGISPLKALAGTTTLDLTGTASGFSLIGEQIYTTAGTYTWIAPSGLTNVHAVCIGAGGVGGSISAPSNGRGGGGGGLGWKNNISVSPGVSYTVVAGAANQANGVNGGDSYFISTGTVCGNGGKSFDNGGAGGSYVGSGGGSGGTGGYGYASGAGGAGGYSGSGGNGGGATSSGSSGSGGGAGGGGSTYCYAHYWQEIGNGGGGTGIYGAGTSGAGGGSYYGTTSWTSVPGGVGGSGGTNGGAGYWYWGGSGGAYGGGSGTGGPDGASWSSMPGAGVVRIIWGSGRSYPSNAA